MYQVRSSGKHKPTRRKGTARLGSAPSRPQDASWRFRAQERPIYIEEHWIFKSRRNLI